jgi:enamine deaminase RidA (YjgF/YER057c/UK114 family)
MGAHILQPKAWKRPKGYANGMAASGRHVYTAGVVGWNDEEEFEHKDFAGQFRQVLLNTRAILAEGGASPDDIVRMTCYVTDKREYLAKRKEIGAAWREIFGDAYPCMAVVEVAALMEAEAKVEIETTAIVAGRSPPDEREAP